MRFGIIGAGTMGRVHAGALTHIANATLVAFAAPHVPPLTTALATEQGIQVMSSAEELLARPDIDAVIIATPTDTHHDLVLAAARAGKHIICEKPLARTVAQGEALLEAVAQAGVKLAVGHVVRYFPDYALAHHIIARHELGTPGVARATRGAGFPRVEHDWYSAFERSGGVVLDMMIHDLDWLRWTFGPVERLHAHGLTFAGIPGKDAAMAVLRFRSGALAYVEASWAYPSGFRTSLEVSGSAGLIRTASREGAPLRFELQPTDRGAGVAVPTGGLVEDPYLTQLRSLAGWLMGGAAPRSTAEDALEAVRLSLAVIESIQRGTPMTFTQET